MSHTTAQTRAGHAGLVLPPLFLTMVFCFALVLVQQHQANTRTAAAKEAYQKKAPAKLSPSSLENATPLPPIVVAPPSTATAKTANPAVAAPTQPSKKSGSAVQGAAASSKPDSIIYEVTKPVTGTLNNLLN